VPDERPPERDVAEMEERSERLEQEIEATRDDWERKRRDPSVPGAEPPPDDDRRDPAIQAEQETEHPGG
jgi:hypothetical protein